MGDGETSKTEADEKKGQKRSFRAMSGGMGLLLASLRSEAPVAEPTPPTETPALLHPLPDNFQWEEPVRKPKRKEKAWKIHQQEKKKGIEPLDFLNLAEWSEARTHPPTTSDLSLYNPELLQSIEKPFERILPGRSVQVKECNNFLKAVKWSPSGLYLLSSAEDRRLRTFRLDPAALTHPDKRWLRSEFLRLVSSPRDGDLVYDIAWHPSFLRNLYASTARQQPVHLREAETGRCVATYRAINHLDEVASASSIVFTASGRRLITGFDRKIRLFDTLRPGRQIMDVATTVGLYNENAKEILCSWDAHEGGITHVQYSPDNVYVFSGARKDPEIRCWDVRMPGHLVSALKRHVSTNQRVYFDLTPDGGWLVSGGDEGEMRVWADPTRLPAAIDAPPREPDHIFKAHSTMMAAISLNPVWGLVGTGSGQRVFPCPLLEGESGYEAGTVALHNALRLWHARTDPEPAHTLAELLRSL